MKSQYWIHRKPAYMKYLKYRLAVWLFDLAARVYPMSPDVGRVAQSHYVGNVWLSWALINPKRKCS